jgi:hypothetical protein
MITSTASRVPGIVTRCQARFRPENFGYANAIKSGSLRIEDGMLELMTVPMPLQSPPEYFGYSGASMSVVKELTKEGVSSMALEIKLPVEGREREEAILHSICIAEEGVERFVIGLTPPLDDLLGIYPFERFEAVNWLRNYKGDMLGENPFRSSPDAEIWEIPAWNIGEPDTKTKPLMARIVRGNMLGIAELGLGVANGQFCALLVSRILAFDPCNCVLISEWENDLGLFLPQNRWDFHALDLSLSGDRRVEIFPDLEVSRLASSKIRKRAAWREKEGARLLFAVWPTVAEFFGKLPVADIQGLASSQTR